MTAAALCIAALIVPWMRADGDFEILGHSSTILTLWTRSETNEHGGSESQAWPKRLESQSAGYCPENKDKTKGEMLIRIQIAEGFGAISCAFAFAQLVLGMAFACRIMTRPSVIVGLGVAAILCGGACMGAWGFAVDLFCESTFCEMYVAKAGISNASCGYSAGIYLMGAAVALCFCSFISLYPAESEDDSPAGEGDDDMWKREPTHEKEAP